MTKLKPGSRLINLRADPSEEKAALNPASRLRKLSRSTSTRRVQQQQQVAALPTPPERGTFQRTSTTRPRLAALPNRRSSAVRLMDQVVSKNSQFDVKTRGDFARAIALRYETH